MRLAVSATILCTILITVSADGMGNAVDVSGTWAVEQHLSICRGELQSLKQLGSEMLIIMMPAIDYDEIPPGPAYALRNRVKKWPYALNLIWPNTTSMSDGELVELWQTNMLHNDKLAELLYMYVNTRILGNTPA